MVQYQHRWVYPYYEVFVPCRLRRLLVQGGPTTTLAGPAGCVRAAATSLAIAVHSKGNLLYLQSYICEVYHHYQRVRDELPLMARK